jgi:hypothetical protein
MSLVRGDLGSPLTLVAVVALSPLSRLAAAKVRHRYNMCTILEGGGGARPSRSSPRPSHRVVRSGGAPFRRWRPLRRSAVQAPHGGRLWLSFAMVVGDTRLWDGPPSPPPPAVGCRWQPWRRRHPCQHRRWINTVVGHPQVVACRSVAPLVEAHC